MPRCTLCSPCNRAIGLFQDDPAILRKAADYLSRDVRITSGTSTTT